MLKRLALAFAALALCACTPAQVDAWLNWRSVDPVAAEAFLASYQRQQALGRCGEWFDLAMAVGFTPDQWPTIDRIMYRESMCLPHVQNPSGASGLMQVMPMWADDCGGTRGDLFDPTFNLQCSVHILNVQGWQAWSTY